MTELQFGRWKDFALRMARTCYRTSRRPSGAWIAETVDDFFSRLDTADIPCIVSWDHSTAYLEGNPCYGRERHLSWCSCDGQRRYDAEPNPQCKECHGSGSHHAPCRALCVGDMMTEFLYEYEPVARVECQACLSGNGGGPCQCDELTDLAREQWNEQYGGPIRCCIRAGLDLASEPSAGVVGFEAGDVRRAYPEGVPDWINGPGEKWTIWLSDPVRENGTFAEMADSVPLVL